MDCGGRREMGQSGIVELNKARQVRRDVLLPQFH
jgi:hypothetical protein